MIPHKHPTYRFWLYIYTFPAMIPLLLNVAFILLGIHEQMEKAMGIQGSILGSRIEIALAATFIFMVLAAHGMAWWHTATGLPRVPDNPPTFPDSEVRASPFWRAAGRAVARLVPRKA